tara:strand:- start:2537 stop:4126 length:1590 start_codon:yes stop_codon:yes gene_type:complete
MRLSARNKHLVLDCRYEDREIAKALGGKWDKKRKYWWFYPSLMSYLNLKAADDVEIDQDITNYFSKKLQYYNDQKNQKNVSNIRDFKFKTRPYDHQYKITDLFLSSEKAFTFAGVGTGKSKAVIDTASVLYARSQVKKILVVCPASIMVNFADEIATHSNLEVVVIDGSIDKRKGLLTIDVPFHIINYDILVKLEKILIKKQYDMMIFDEIHYCKNRASQRSRAAYKISQGVKYRFGLTGTIISNNYEDLFMPYKIIDEKILGEYFTQFKNRYFVMGGYMGYETLGFQNEDELKRLIGLNSIKFELRDVKDLPPEVIIKKKITLTPKSMKKYQTLKKEMVLEHQVDDKPVFNILERLMRLSQITSGFITDTELGKDDFGDEKLAVLKDLLEEIEGKVIIFARFRHSIDKIRKMCEECGYSAYIYDGRTKEKGLYHKFNSDDTKVWISQIQKGEGYSIPMAKYAIFYELNYSRKDHVQCKGRNLRLTGSDDGSCYYIYLLAENTIDEVIYQTLQDKEFTSRDALEFVKGI